MRFIELLVPFSYRSGVRGGPDERDANEDVEEQVEEGVLAEGNEVLLQDLDLLEQVEGQALNELEDHDEAKDHDGEVNILQHLGPQVEGSSTAPHLFGREFLGHQIKVILFHIVLVLIYGVAPGNIEHGHQNIEERYVDHRHLVVRLLAKWPLEQRLVLAPLARQQLNQLQK